MKISIVTPAAARSRNGNRNTATRWAGFLRELGHKVEVEQQWSGGPADVMIALHARRSHPSIRAYSESFSGRPLVVVLTGTDLYRDIRSDPDAQRSLSLATHLVVLQELGAMELPTRFRSKTRTIYQSARAAATASPLTGCFEVVVSGHLREEKDPFRTAAAVALLPPESRIRVTHMGGALTPEMAAEARGWMEREPRYRWLGELPRWRALRVLARSRLMVISSRMEGGANVVCEAIASRVPVIASRVRGNVGMLGPHYPGYYPLADERALARLLARAERDRAYYSALARACAARAKLVTPDRERDSLERLLADACATSQRVRKPSRVRAAA
ncbi:MAG TPA: selenoneine biosynthesis selenosugar synthase SenB [Burkholderiales bacterium]|nr:selenoneine biosynthesis selenosugar synthase SenB [Burkholderiales bacterium]